MVDIRLVFLFVARPWQKLSSWVCYCPYLDMSGWNMRSGLTCLNNGLRSTEPSGISCMARVGISAGRWGDLAPPIYSMPCLRSPKGMVLTPQWMRPGGFQGRKGQWIPKIFSKFSFTFDSQMEPGGQHGHDHPCFLALKWWGIQALSHGTCGACGQASQEKSTDL